MPTLLAATSSVRSKVTRGAIHHPAKKAPCISPFSRKARRGGTPGRGQYPFRDACAGCPRVSGLTHCPLRTQILAALPSQSKVQSVTMPWSRSALPWLGLGRVDLGVRADRVLFGRRQSFALQCRGVRRRCIRAAHRCRRKRVQRRNSVVIQCDGDISDRHQPKRDGQSLAPSCKPAVTEVPRCLVYCHDHLLLTCCYGTPKFIAPKTPHANCVDESDPRPAPPAGLDVDL